LVIFFQISSLSARKR